MAEGLQLVSRKLLSVGFAGLLVAFSALFGVLADPVAANHIPYAPGDVFAAVGNGKINHFSPTGTLIEVLDTTSGSTSETGMCFDASGNLRSTNFDSQTMTLFNNQGGVLQHPWGGPFNQDPESCLVDASGNVYVGQADGTRDVLKFNGAGLPLANYNVATTDRGSDWIDLAADQKTLFYTSEGPEVKRFDVSTNTQLPDFATGLPQPCFALRIRPNGEVLVACFTAVIRLNAAGAVIQSYPAASYGIPNDLFALNLDPDNTSFWTASISGKIVRIDIATGALVTSFSGLPLTGLFGLAIFGERTAAASPCAATPGPGDIVGTPGNDKLVGTAGNDRIFGLGGDDQIAGLGGDDLIIGGPGMDSLSGGDGNDTLCGGDDRDFLSGGNGNDQLFGQGGDDDLAGSPGDDMLDGGPGDDRLDGGTGTNVMHGGAGTDSCVNPPATISPCPV